MFGSRSNPPRHGDCDVLTPATVGEGFEKHVKQARRSDEGYCKPRPLGGQGALQRSGPGRVIGGGGPGLGENVGFETWAYFGKSVGPRFSSDGSGGGPEFR
jgi:hypothetical protein